MNESISIKNFGPIKDVTIDNIRPFTVFIGPSGSGKSTIVKLIALFRWIYKMMCIRAFISKSGIKKSIKFDFLEYLSNNEQDHFVKIDTEISYQIGSVKLRYTKKSGLTGTKKLVSNEDLGLEKISFIADKRVVLSDLQAGSLIRRFNTYYLNQTLGDYIWATQFVKALDIPFLGVRFEVQKTNGGVKHLISSLNQDAPYTIELNEASSGMQAAIPLMAITEYYARYYDLNATANRSLLTYVSQADNWTDFTPVMNINNFKNRRVTLCLEEPEISLFPNAQSGLMRFLANRCFNMERDYQMSVLMTTHSPYIMNVLNVLIHETKNSGCRIPVEQMSAYIIGDGGIKDLMCSRLDGRRIIDTNDLNEDMRQSLCRYNELMKE